MNEEWDRWKASVGMLPGGAEAIRANGMSKQEKGIPPDGRHVWA